jgi:hypothetical protein
MGPDDDLVKVSASDLRGLMADLPEVIHCIDMCGPMGSLRACGMCEPCEVRAALGHGPDAG